MKETDDDESNGNEWVDDDDDEDEEDDEDDEDDGLMRMIKMLGMRTEMKMRMVIMICRAVVGLHNLVRPASENPLTQ